MPSSGTYSYSIHTNNSGGSINSSTGVYTAGSTPSVTDTVRVTDGLGNYKRERNKRIADNRLNGRWAPSRKLHDGPERIFEE